MSYHEAARADSGPGLEEKRVSVVLETATKPVA
jgi:hypothetical protein